MGREVGSISRGVQAEIALASQSPGASPGCGAAHLPDHRKPNWELQLVN